MGDRRLTVETTATTTSKLGARKLGFPVRFFYGFGSIAFGVKDSGFSYFLLIFYNQVVGLSAGLAGLAILIALVADSFLDPLIGQLSDNLRSKWGRRHPFMYASAIPVAITYFVLWNPPRGLSQGALFVYLIAIAILIRSLISCYEIPSSALAAELTTDYDERTTLLSFRFWFGWLGGLVMYYLATRFFLQPDKTHPVGMLNDAGYSHYGVVAACLMLVAILVSAIGTHRQIPNLRHPPQRRATYGVLFKEMLGTLSHRTFLMILTASFFNAMAIGLGFSVNLYFQIFFWQLHSSQIANFTFSSLIAVCAAASSAAWLSKRFGKRGAAMTLITASITIGVTPITLRLLGLFPENGSAWVYPILFVGNIFATGMGTTGQILFSSMIADVVEDSELRTGRRQEGLFFAAAAFIAKAVSGVGVFMSAMIVALIHLPARAVPGKIDPAVVRHLGEFYVPTAAGLYGLAVLFLLGYKITRSGHEDTLRKLAAASDLIAEGEPVESAPESI
jgi:GPH family glycoside/pentoside/hexuronide:cation symporter